MTRCALSRASLCARRCTNPDCEYGGRWIVGKMVVLRNGRFLCRGRDCHSIYDAREVIDQENEDYPDRQDPRLGSRGSWA